MKIYLTNNGALEIDKSGIINTIPAGTLRGRWDFDNQLFDLEGDILRTTSISEIFKENGDPYTDLNELKTAIGNFF